MLRSLPLPPTKPIPPAPQSFAAIASAIFNGEHKYTEIKVPCLAIFAVPHDASVILPTDPVHHAAAIAFELERATNVSNAFASGVPSAKVVRLRNANHYVFRSNEAEVIHYMKDFLDMLPQPSGPIRRE